MGAGGYTGAELIGVLLAHPNASLVGAFGSGRSGASPALAELHPRFRCRTDLVVQPADVGSIVATGADAVFLATPHDISQSLAPELVAAGLIVLDLSGAFRLSGDEACLHYGTKPSGVTAVYGLPERHAEAIAQADLIAVPGCYPTASVLAIAPLVDAGLLDPSRPVIVDAVSGVSGAGRSPNTRSHFCEVSYQPYGVLTHRHEPEIIEHAGADVVFTPHLGSYVRGIVATIHASLASGVDGDVVRDVFETAYANASFVRIHPSGTWPSVAGVAHTNFCDIGMAVDGRRGHLIVVSAIDNLLKGAAGQAVQCLNLRFGLPETAGLLEEPSCLSC